MTATIPTIPALIESAYVGDSGIPVGALSFPDPSRPRMARLVLGDRVLYIDDYDEDGQPDPAVSSWVVYVDETDGDGTGYLTLVETDGGTREDGERRIARFILDWKEGER